MPKDFSELPEIELSDDVVVECFRYPTLYLERLDCDKEWTIYFCGKIFESINGEVFEFDFDEIVNSDDQPKNIKLEMQNRFIEKLIEGYTRGFCIKNTELCIPEKWEKCTKPKFPYFAYFRYEGIRCSFVPGKKSKLLSLSSKELEIHDEIKEEIIAFSAFLPASSILDIELYNKKIAPSNLRTKLKSENYFVVVQDFWTSDGNLSCLERMKYLIKAMRGWWKYRPYKESVIRVVYPYLVNTQEDIEEIYKLSATSCQGILLKSIDSIYRGGKTKNCWKKMTVITEEVQIEEVIRGEHNLSIKVRNTRYPSSSTKEFYKVSLPLTINEKEKVLENLNVWRGSKCIIKYRCLSSEGIPIKASAKFSLNVRE